MATTAVHGTMGWGQKILKLMWRCHQLLSGFLAKGHLLRVSCHSRQSLLPRVSHISYLPWSTYHMFGYIWLYRNDYTRGHEAVFTWTVDSWHQSRAQYFVWIRARSDWHNNPLTVTGPAQLCDRRDICGGQVSEHGVRVKVARHRSSRTNYKSKSYLLLKGNLYLQYGKFVL